MNTDFDSNPFIAESSEVIQFRKHLSQVGEKVEVKQPEGFKEVISAAFKGLGDKLHQFFYYITHFASVPDFKLTKLDMNRAHLEEKKDHIAKEFREDLEKEGIDIGFLKSQGIDPEGFVEQMFMPAIEDLIHFERGFKEIGVPTKNEDLLFDVGRIREFETAFNAHKVKSEKAIGTALLNMRRVLGERYDKLTLQMTAARETVDESIAAEKQLIPHTKEFLELRNKNDELSKKYRDELDLADKYDEIIEKINKKLGINEDDLTTELDNLDLLEMIDDE